jgi:tetratricopeptide (TPR) repeat protein
VPWPAVVLTVLAGGVAVGLAVGDTDDDDPCRQTLVPLDELWGSDTAGKLSAHLGEALPTTRAAEAVIERLDVFADAWRRGRLTACLADEDGEREGDGDAALRRSCFDLRLVELGTWLDVLRNDDPAQTRAAAIAVEGIESPTVCDDLANLRRNAVTSVPEASLGRAQALQEQLQRGIVYASAGRHEQAISILDDTIAAAEALDIRVLQAGALAERAALCLRRQEFEAAEDNGLEAYRIGVRERNDDVALTAAVVMARLCNESQMPAAATEAWAVHALALAERRGDPATQAKVYEALAIAHSEGAPDRSREYFDLAVEAAQVAHGARSHALAVVRLNAGVADLRRGDATSAQAHLEEALAVVEELDGVDTHLTVHTRRELAAAVGAAGDRTRALGLCRENLPHIVAAFGRQSMQYGQQLELMAALACDDGDLDGCARYATDSIAAFEASLGPEARFLLGPLVSLAEAHARRGDTKAARVAARRGKALALLHDAPEGAAHFEAVAPAPAR